MTSIRTRLALVGMAALVAGTAAQAQQPAPKPKAAAAAPATHDTAKHTPAAGARPHADSARHAGKKKKRSAMAPAKP